MQRRSGPVRHLLVHAQPKPDIDPETGVEWCARCNLAETNDIHRLPEVTPEQRAFEQRRVGERG